MGGHGPREAESMKLKHRVVLSMLSVVVVSGSVSTLIGGYLLWRHLEGEAQNRVRQDLNAAYEFYNQRLNAIGDALQYTALGDRFAEAVADKDLDYIRPRLRSVSQRAKLDMLTATDAGGRVILRTHRPSLAGDVLVDAPLLSLALSGTNMVCGTGLIPLRVLERESPALARKARIRLVPTPRAAPAPRDELAAGMTLCCAATVHDSKGRLVGALWAGALLNHNYDLVDQVQNTVFRDERYKGKLVGTATVFQRDVRIATNVLQRDGTRAIGTRVSAEVYDSVLRRGRTWVGPAWVLNDWYISAYAPLRDVQGKAIGMLYVGVLERKFRDLALRTFATFTMVMGTGVVLAAVVAWHLANSIARPIGSLARASAAIAKGDFSQKLHVETADEIGSLTQAFNTMARSLQERDDLLKERTRLQLTRSERLAAVGRLAAGVAHEINNPLTGVLTFAHLLLRQAPEGSEQREDLNTIIESTVRCKDIVRGLLNFSRQNEPHKALTSLNDVLRKALNLTQNQAAIGQVSIREDMDPDLPQLVIDPNQIQEVAVNVIVNAIDAMEQGGELTVRTRTVVEDGARWAQFDISDTGCGITPGNLERIFDPFFTTKRSGQGTGLGLAVSYGIVMEHRGQINVVSEEGRGATVTVRLPMAAED